MGRHFQLRQKGKDARDIELAREKSDFDSKMLNFSLSYFMNMFGMFAKITIQWIALFSFRTADPRTVIDQFQLNHSEKL